MGDRVERKSLTVPKDIQPIRIDKYLSEHPDLDISRSFLQQMIKDDRVIVGGKPVSKNTKLKGGEIIDLTIPPPEKIDLTPEKIPLDIVYEDEFLAIINKSPGLVVHPAPGNPSHTLVNAILYHFNQIEARPDDLRPGIVHRLDRDTSGLLMVAKKEKAARLLREMMSRREISKTYLGIVCGHMNEEEGTINLPIGRSIKNRKKMTVTNLNSREAVTHYKVTDRYRTLDRLDIRLETGRTHQIRVHFSHFNHPVLGDPEYGGRQKWIKGMDPARRSEAEKILNMIDRQALHAWKLEFKHPITEEEIEVSAAPPDDFARLISYLETNYRL